MVKWPKRTNSVGSMRGTYVYSGSRSSFNEDAAGTVALQYVPPRSTADLSATSKRPSCSCDPVEKLAEFIQGEQY